MHTLVLATIIAYVTTISIRPHQAWSTPVYEKHAGGRHIRTSGQEIATLFTMDKWLDNYKVMTSMNMAM